jgi:phosphomevalonate kinase
MSLSEQYAKSCDIPLKHFHLTIDSNLDDANGNKYGLGSSAAVLVSVVKASNESVLTECHNF